MKESTLHSLLHKAEELKVVEFLQEVIGFVRDIKPLLENVNVSVADNLAKMPQATKKLSKVTEATEVATTEIMNTLDGVFDKTTKISNCISKITVKEEELIHKNEADTLITAINDDATSIMMALQVQDITSQQIAAVNHLLETMKVKLAGLIKNFDMGEIADIIQDNDTEVKTSHLHREIAFDPDAVDAISNKHDRQDIVNQIIDAHENNDLEKLSNMETKSSQDDIDALFAELNNSESNSFSENELDSNIEEFSQDDIDALFGK